MLNHHAYGMERKPRLHILLAVALLFFPLLPTVVADDDLANSSLMTDGNSVTGNVDYGGDVRDWWKIYALTGDVVQVSVSTSMNNPAWWCPGDGYEGKVKLTDPQGNLLAGDTTISDASSSTVLSTTMASADYVHLRIQSEDSWCNDGIDYTLTPILLKDNRDTDDDGFTDTDDDCDDNSGNSTNDRNGCLDSDGDGYSDAEPGWSAHPQGQADAFPNEPSQWHDTDGDGYGDQISGFEGDHCTYDRGFSDQDRFGCFDSDTDGWSDPDPLGLNGTAPWPAHPLGSADAFLHDVSQWNDTDGDGYGDNWADGNWNDSRVNQSEPLGQWVDNSTEPDACPTVFGQSQSDRWGCPDGDGDSWSNPDENWSVSDGADAFADNPSQWSDRDNDGWGDNQTVGATQVDDFPDNPTQWLDSDGDGYGDNQTMGAWQVDNFTLEISQWQDVDGDGYGDNISGFEGDVCPDSLIEHVANSQISMYDRFGCYDSDKDGYSNPSNQWVAHPEGFADAFPDEPSQWHDSDSDNYGDNLEWFNGTGMGTAYRGDSCKDTAGTSTDDRWGCLDSDGDGWSNPTWDWLASPQGLADAWSGDETQWHDRDGDGYGDNPMGTTADVCPDDAGTSLGSEAGGDRWGCHDTDGDGWSDLSDAFPHEPTQWRDSDGDGWGDNELGHEGDACPTLRGDSLLDRSGCRDSDADGWSDPSEGWGTLDGADAFPNDRMQWKDSDYDGYGDNAIGAKRDDCPKIAGTSTIDLQGCPDSNKDGYSDSFGDFEAALTIMGSNPTGSWLSFTSVGAAIFLALIITRGGGLFIRREKIEDKVLAELIAPETEEKVPVIDMNTGHVQELSPQVAEHAAHYTGIAQLDPSNQYSAAATESPYGGGNDV
jgi:hypothetical protein